VIWKNAKTGNIHCERGQYHCTVLGIDNNYKWAIVKMRSKEKLVYSTAFVTSGEAKADAERVMDQLATNRRAFEDLRSDYQGRWQLAKSGNSYCIQRSFGSGILFSSW
jgi:hypothetical protein